MSEMVERVARAIAKGEYGENVDDVWQTCIDDARAAIEAMREPAEAMNNAGSGLEQEGTPATCHNAMVGQFALS